MRLRSRAPALAAVVAAALLGITLPGSAAPVSAIQGAAPNVNNLEIKLLEAPVARKDDPRALIYIIDHVAPGTSFSREVQLSNNTGVPMAVSAYGGGGVLGDGTFSFIDELPPGEEPGDSGHDAAELDRARELASWISVTPDAPRLDAGQKATAKATITVPADAAPGERYGVIWAEIRSAAPDATGIITVNRVGIRVYLSVGPGNEPASDFTVEDTRVERAADGTLVATAAVRNTGGRALDLTSELSLSDGPGGVETGPVRSLGATTLGLGEAGSVSVPLDGQLAAGEWEARMVVRSGRTERVRTNDVLVPGVVVPEDGPPWLLIAGVAAVVLAVGVVVALATRARRRASSHAA